jgi:hypothetical protein
MRLGLGARSALPRAVSPRVKAGKPQVRRGGLTASTFVAEIKPPSPDSVLPGPEVRLQSKPCSCEVRKEERQPSADGLPGT